MTVSVDETITQLAVAQHGLVSRAQLLEAGVTSDTIDYRVTVKRLRPLQRGVYLVGPLIAQYAPEMAAVLACGRDAVVSHRSAAAIWQLLPKDGDSAPIDITVAGRDVGRRGGIRSHRVRYLTSSDVTTIDAIPVTTVSRTLMDLAVVVRPRELEQSIAQAERRNLLNRSELAALVAARSGRRGVRALDLLLRAIGSPALTRSEAEERFLALIRRAQLPAPETNVFVAGYEIDFLWRRAKLAVEIDGFAYHASRRQFESDRRRDGQLSARGLRVMRITWRQIMKEPEAVIVRVGQALARSDTG